MVKDVDDVVGLAKMAVFVRGKWLSWLLGNERHVDSQTSSPCPNHLHLKMNNIFL